MVQIRLHDVTYVGHVIALQIPFRDGDQNHISFIILHSTQYERLSNILS